jgi:LacI family transcriptional regulator, gluconate utilization system Gnt-I transcriptional repressor
MAEPPTTAERRSRRGSGGITLTDVAKLAGVAPITASRALNTPSQVSAEVLKRVREAVERTGYVPNMLAGGLASSRSRLVAAVVPTIVGPVFQESLQSLTEALAQAGYQLMLGQSGYRESREDLLLEQIIGRRPDGIVLTGILHSAAGRRRLQASGLPVVETWDLTPTPIDMLVGFSHEQAGAAVADYLYAQGRSHLAVLSGDDDRALRRYRGFVDRVNQLNRLGAGPGEVPGFQVPAPTSVRSGREKLGELLALAPHTDAVFCGSDMMALGVLNEALKRGIAVPEELAVVGFGDLAFAADLQPPLTTVRIDGTRIGRLAARFIIERVEGREVGERVIDVGFTIERRESA